MFPYSLSCAGWCSRRAWRDQHRENRQTRQAAFTVDARDIPTSHFFSDFFSAALLLIKYLGISFLSLYFIWGAIRHDVASFLGKRSLLSSLVIVNRTCAYVCVCLLVLCARCMTFRQSQVPFLSPLLPFARTHNVRIRNIWRERASSFLSSSVYIPSSSPRAVAPDWCPPRHCSCSTQIFISASASDNNNDNNNNNNNNNNGTLMQTDWMGVKEWVEERDKFQCDNKEKIRKERNKEKTGSIVQGECHALHCTRTDGRMDG